jgi:ribosome biogenesis GTPase A
MQDFSQYPLTGWYPGHMLKAGKEMRGILSLVDLVVELIDARAPLSSRNPNLRSMLEQRPFIMVANKTDLAQPAVSKAWEAWFTAQGERIFLLDSRRIANVRGLTELWRRIVMEHRALRGAVRPLVRPVRIMIAGIPNIGKSTLVNHLHEKNKAQVGPKPGVTRQNQWISLEGGVELLDTPGILWPRITTKRHELLLALLGSLKEELVEPSLLAEFLWSELVRLKAPVNWPDLGSSSCPTSITECLENLARRRGLLRSGGVLDVERAAIALIKDYRDGKLGRISFERPPSTPPTF